MQRRRFLHYLGSGLAASSLYGLPGCRLGGMPPQTDLTGRLTALTDVNIPGLMQQQETNADHPWRGGFRNGDGVHMPNTAASVVRLFTAAYISPPSAYFRSGELLRSMEEAVAYLQRVQHEDGTIDLLSTNFHSTPDTAFAVEPLCQAYALLNGQAGSEAPGLRVDEDDLLNGIREFLLSAGETLIAGGIHTPNHRWVVSMALSRLHALFPDIRYVSRVDEWLAEGIDIDPDGQYTEKSTAIYSPLTDRCFITMARLLDRSELLDPVRKNLEMTLYYLHPNGEIVTEASGRQDQFRVAFPDQYYYPYRYMALKEGDPRFAVVARQMEESRLEYLWQNLGFFLEEPALQEPLPEAGTLPVNYVKPFPYSHLVRIRRGETDATILARNHTFFTLFKNSAALQAVQLSMAFFGEGEFESAEVEDADGEFRLRWQLSKGYYQLFPADDLPGDGDWEKMPREERPLSEEQHLEALVVIGEKNGKFSLEFDIHGTDDVPVSLELAFRHGGKLEGVRAVEGKDNAWLLTDGTGTYTFEGNTITFGPGRAAHQWLELRGGSAKKDAMSVFLTGYTPFRHILTLK